MERGSISGLRLIDASPELQKLPRRDSMQPTAYFEGTAFIGQEFYIEYEFDNSIIYRNMAGAAAQEGPMAYEDGQWLAEKPPHICFTPYLKMCIRDRKPSAETSSATRDCLYIL